MRHLEKREKVSSKIHNKCTCGNQKFHTSDKCSSCYHKSRAGKSRATRKNVLSKDERRKRLLESNLKSYHKNKEKNKENKRKYYYIIRGRNVPTEEEVKEKK